MQLGGGYARWNFSPAPVTIIAGVTTICLMTAPQADASFLLLLPDGIDNPESAVEVSRVTARAALAAGAILIAGWRCSRIKPAIIRLYTTLGLSDFPRTILEAASLQSAAAAGSPIAAGTVISTMGMMTPSRRGIGMIGGLINGFHVKVVVVGVAKRVDRGLTEWREAQVRGLAALVEQQEKGKYSVMVASRMPLVDRPDVCLFRKESIPWYDRPFHHIRLGLHVVLIPKDVGPVVITRVGDGGYINWAFQGVWARGDSVVTFNPSCLVEEPGACNAADGSCSVVACSA